MAQANINYIKVTFDDLKQLFIKQCKKIGLFVHSQAFGYTPDEAFETYRDCWIKHLIREETISRRTASRWKQRGWVDEDMRNDFMEYCFGNRWRTPPSPPLGRGSKE